MLSYCRELVAASGVLILPGAACYEVGEAARGDAHFRIGLGRLDVAANLAVYEAALKDARFGTVQARK